MGADKLVLRWMAEYRKERTRVEAWLDERLAGIGLMLQLRQVLLQ